MTVLVPALKKYVSVCTEIGKTREQLTMLDS